MINISKGIIIRLSRIEKIMLRPGNFIFEKAKASQAEQMISSIIATRLNDTNNREVSEASTNAIVDAIRSK